MKENCNMIDGLIGEAYSSAKYANMIPGTLAKAKQANKEEFKQILLNQIKIIQSEVNETLEAIEQNDSIETLDGAGDMLVTTMGFLQILQEKVQAREALLDICANNLTKFVSVWHPEKEAIILETVEMYEKEGLKVTPVLNNQLNAIAFMTEEGKYKKPSGYLSVDLSKYIDEPFI